MSESWPFLWFTHVSWAVLHLLSPSHNVCVSCYLYFSDVCPQLEGAFGEGKTTDVLFYDFCFLSHCHRTKNYVAVFT